MNDFEKSIKILAELEGGYVNDPRDRGGETFAGITRKGHPDLKMWGIIDALKRGGYTARQIDAELLTYADVRADIDGLYRKQYWDKCKCDCLPWCLNAYVFDMAVNSGPANAVKTLQRMLDVVVDGDIGPKTLEAAVKCSTAKYDQFLTLRREFYDNIVKRDSSQKRFLNGWHNRLDRLRAAAMNA